MQNLKYYQDIIREKRKKTDFKKYLMEVASWQPVVFHRNSGIVSRFPKTPRIGKIIKMADFYEKNSSVYYEGLEYNNKINFFTHFSTLLKGVYLPHMVNFFGSENSEYADVVNKSSEVYLSSVVIFECQNILYSFAVKDNSINVLNSMMVNVDNNNIYSCVGIVRSYNIFYSKYITNSANIWFCSNLIGCKECINCNNLDNCSYYIENKEYSKEEYLVKKNQILSKKETFQKMYTDIKEKGNFVDCDNVDGNFIVSSDNIKQGYFVNNTHNGRNLFFTGGKDGNEEMYDIFNGGAPIANNIYGVNGVGNGSENVFIGANLPACHDVYYSFFLQGCSYCIGCVGLKNKTYCILNKQYTKETWGKIADSIFQKMENEGILGDFFPGELNPFYFNDTFSGLLGSFSKEKVLENGYMWRDEEIKVDIPDDAEVINTSDLQDFQGFDAQGNWRINPEILKKVIVDNEGNYYKIVQMEYDFLVKHGLPLPELHWLDRMKLNLGV